MRAVDGTCIQLPRSKEILEAFPVRSGGYGDSNYPYSYLLAVTDVFTSQVTHAIINNKYSSEINELLTLLPSFDEGDISVMDRGFTGKRMWKAFDDHKQHYLSRLSARRNGQTFFNQRKTDQILDVGDGQKVRVIRGPKFKTGNHLFLATNLLDQKKYSRNDLIGLFKRRQAVEDCFLNFKSKLKAKDIRSRKVNGVLQEIFAALTMASFLAGIRYLFEKGLGDQRVSFKAFMLRFRTAFDIVLKAPSALRAQRLFFAIEHFGHRKQPGRSYPRYSLQPPNKWIQERSRKKTNAAKRAKSMR